MHVLFHIFQVYVLQDTELMKFVFNRDPTTVQRKLPEFKSQLEGAFAQPYKFNIYDTEFYSKVDGSLDFGRTRYEIKSTILFQENIGSIRYNTIFFFKKTFILSLQFLFPSYE